MKANKDSFTVLYRSCLIVCVYVAGKFSLGKLESSNSAGYFWVFFWAFFKDYFGGILGVFLGYFCGILEYFGIFLILEGTFLENFWGTFCCFWVFWGTFWYFWVHFGTFCYFLVLYVAFWYYRLLRATTG